MRRVVLDTIMSLDGYFTDSKNEIEWFQFEEGDMKWSHDILTTAGTLVFGRTTYLEFSKIWPKMDAISAGWDPYIVDSLNKLPKTIFSTTLKKGEWGPSTIVKTDPAKEVSRLKKGTGKDILIIGSGSIVNSLLRAGLVDQFYLRVQPIILGSGKSLFKDMLTQLPLTLVEAKTFKSGVQALHYTPTR